MKLLRLLGLLLAFAAAGGCSTLSNLTEKPESQWTVADYYAHMKEAFDNEQWEQTIKYGEKLLAYYPYGKEAEQAYLDLAYAYYKWDEPQSAIRTLNDFIRLYPRHRVLPWAYYLRARAAEAMVTSFFDRWITDPARRSAETLRQAFNYYKAVADKFPNSEYARVARRKMVIFYNRIARHDYYVAEFYFERGADLAAIERVKALIHRYPHAVAVLDGLKLMEAAYRRLGMTPQADHVRDVLVATYEKQVQRPRRETRHMQERARRLEHLNRRTRGRSLRWSNSEPLY